MKIKYFFASAALMAATVVPAQNVEQVRQLIKELEQQVNLLEKTQQSASEQHALAITSQSPSVDPLHDTNGILPLDTLQTINDAVKIVIYNDNSWKYIRDKEFIRDSAVYTCYWDTTTISPYREFSLASLPSSIAIDLVDSLKCYHYPHKGSVYSKYGVRHRRQHQGVDLPLKIGDPVYSAFDGRVRISEYNQGGYGNLIIVRHDNGLETYYGHLSERLVQSGDWVEAGQIIGLGGSTGRSTGPHLHFETRYYGQTFDPERLIDFESGVLRRQTFLLKKSFFDIRSSAAQDFEQEDGGESDEKKEASVKKEAPTSKKADATYYSIKSGDTLGKIAKRHGTTVAKLCSLNGIKSNTTLQINRKLRVK